METFRHNRVLPYTTTTRPPDEQHSYLRPGDSSPDTSCLGALRRGGSLVVAPRKNTRKALRKTLEKALEKALGNKNLETFL